jgi:hypothetical protein
VNSTAWVAPLIRGGAGGAGGFLVLTLAACASNDGRGLVPGQSSEHDVRAIMGQPAETQPLANGDTVYWYPQLPWGHVSYAALIAPDGRLVAFEQRLTEGNISKIVRGQTTAREVHDLLGPAWQPQRYGNLERDVWTYPMRVPGHALPKWYVVQLSYDGIVRETYLFDDPQFVPQDRGGRNR